MKIAINTCYGGFKLPEGVIEEADSFWDDSEDIRTDDRLIEWINEHPTMEEQRPFFDCGGTHLVAVYIPDNATDWEIEEYDGAERIICVVDGKLCMLYGYENDIRIETKEEEDD